MTSTEIKQCLAIDLSTGSWLREACLQLALLNERNTPEPIAISEPIAQPVTAAAVVEPPRVKRAYHRKAR